MNLFCIPQKLVARPTTQARMQDMGKEWLDDLFEAKLKYVTTRPY